jgi:hypothetical protein
MFQHETPQDAEIIKFNQDASQAEIDMKELYKWLERPITEEDEEYREE